MKIALEGKRALIVGPGGAVEDALADALAASGAQIVRVATGAPLPATNQAPFLFVHVSAEIAADMRAAGEGPADEASRFAGIVRNLVPGVRRVVNVISAAGVVPVRGAAAYSARQAALASVTKALAMELGPEVAVNALAVGALAAEPAVAGHLVSHSPLGRAGRAEEFGSAALFLADPVNSYTTGHVMTVDGGWSIGYARNF